MHFEKISYGQWKNDIPFTEIDDLVVRRWYGNIKLPQQGTAHSMGVDFCVPYNIRILAHNKIKIPTGIRWVCDTEEEKTYGLLLVPRSSAGIKCGLRLLNTVGVIDADYADDIEEYPTEEYSNDYDNDDDSWNDSNWDDDDWDYDWDDYDSYDSDWDSDW